MCRYPLPSELRRLSDLGRRHAGGYNLTAACCIGIALASRQVEPHVREHIILRHPRAVGVHIPELDLGPCIALLGGETVPAHRLGVILRYAIADLVHAPKVPLGPCTALLGGENEPAHRLGIILRNVMPIEVDQPEFILGLGIALLGKWKTARDGQPAAVRVGQRRPDRQCQHDENDASEARSHW